MELKHFRKDWVDIVKGIGISLVVIGHPRFSGGLIGDWLNSFHMPLFFIIAGFCFDASRYPDYKSYVVRKIKALLFPYLTLSLFVIAMMSLLYWGNDPQFSTLTLLKNMVTGGTIGAFWFICVLLQVELLFALMVRFISQMRAQILLCLACLSIAISLRGVYLPYFFNIVFLSIPFYGLGYFIKHIEGTRVFNKVLPLAIVASFSLGLHLVLIYFFDPGKTTYVANQYTHPLSFILLAMLGTFSVVLGARAFDLFIKKRGVFFKHTLCFLGKNSILLLALHSALGLCRSSWGISSGISLMLEFLLLAILLYLFSNPFRSFVFLNK